MITQLFRDLQIVVIESPYDTLQDPQVQDLFPRLAALKIEGYRTVYSYGVLPVDTYDFVATHHLVCREAQGRFEILMGYKSVTLAQCLVHHLAFPGMSLLKSSSAVPHDQALARLLETYSAKPERISYGSSWTIHPEARQNRALRNTLKEMMSAMLVSYETENGIAQQVSCGVPLVKTDLYFENLGYQRLKHQGGVLPAFRQSSLIGEEAVMLGCTRFSEHGFQMAEKYQRLWDSRITFKSDRQAADQIKKGAA